MSAVLIAAFVASSVPATVETPILEHFFDAFRIAAHDVPALARFDLDLDGDGAREVFLGLPGNAYGQDWIAYKCAGHECQSLGMLRFHHQAFYYDLNERRLWASVRVGGQSSGYSQYRLGPAGFVVDTTSAPRTLTLDLARAAAWAGHHRALGWANVPDLLHGDERWRTLKGGLVFASGVRVTGLKVARRSGP